MLGMFTRIVGTCKSWMRGHSAGIVSSYINFLVFSFVMASNYKKVCATFRCRVTP